MFLAPKIEYNYSWTIERQPIVYKLEFALLGNFETKKLVCEVLGSRRRYK